MRKNCRWARFGLVTAILTTLSLAPAEAKRKKRILYLGDSMSMGAFGKTMDQEMREAGFDVYTFVAGGATPYYWLSRYSTIKGPIGYWEKTPSQERRQKVTRGVPKVEALLERYDPDVVVVQTGTNLYASLRSKRRTKANNVKEVEGLLNHMVEATTQGGRKLYWITPPQAHEGRYPAELQAELAELTKRVVSREARVFDSRSVTRYTDPYPKNDGIHYGPTEAKQWASHVIQDFRQFMGSGSRPPQGMLAGKFTRRKDMPPEKNFSEIPRAIPVAAPGRKAKVEPIPTKEKPPVKKKPAKKPASSSPPVKTKPAEREPGRPPVQYVKKALPVDTRGVQWGKIDLEVRLVEKSHLKSLKDIDYSYCFAMNEYEVLKVNSGYYPHKRIRIARVIMWGKKLQNAAIGEKIGHVPRGGWTLVPMSNYPRFERMQLVDELPINLDLPTYIIAFE